MANILYRGSAAPTVVNSDGGKNAPLTNLEIDRNFFSLDRDKFDRVQGGTITGNATFAASSTVTIDGNLIVNGTTTTINSTTLTVDDINVVLGDIASPTNISANGGGITLRGTTDKTFNWLNSTGAWTSSEHLALAAGRNILLNGSSSGVITLSAPANAGSSNITFQASSGTVAHLSDIGNGNITVNTGSGLTGSGSFTTNQAGATTVTLSHADTSSVGDLSAANNTFISAITFDTFGHVQTRTTGTVDFTVAANFAFQNFAIGLDSGYSWGGANSNTTQSADSSSDTLTFVKGGGINLYTNTSGTDAILIEHSDTSSVGNFNVDNSGGTVIQDIALTFDTYGHVIGISAASLDGDARWINTSGDTMTGLLTTRSTSGGMAVASQGTDGIQVISDGTGSAAYMTFHRPGAYAVRFGLDTDNVLKIGGWSMGAAAHTIWHSGNLTNLNQLTNGPGYITSAGRAYPRRSDGGDINFIWSGQSGQPTWLWGGTDGTNMYVYNPSNFNVLSAQQATNATNASFARYVYNNGAYGGTVGNIEPSSMRVLYANSAGSATSASLSSEVSINYNNDSNSTYQMLWGSGNSVYGTGGIYCNPATDSIFANGNITAYASSDRSLKENVKDIENALDKAIHVGGKTYDWTDAYIEENGGEDGYFLRKSDFGVIAQDVEEVFPVAVRTKENGTLAVDYEKLVALAFAAIKELNAKVEDLQNQLANK